MYSDKQHRTVYVYLQLWCMYMHCNKCACISSVSCAYIIIILSFQLEVSNLQTVENPAPAVQLLKSTETVANAITSSLTNEKPVTISRNNLGKGPLYTHTCDHSNSKLSVIRNGHIYLLYHLYIQHCMDSCTPSPNWVLYGFQMVTNWPCRNLAAQHMYLRLNCHLHS